jgi:hypothetical protein
LRKELSPHGTGREGNNFGKSCCKVSERFQAEGRKRARPGIPESTTTVLHESSTSISAHTPKREPKSRDHQGFAKLGLAIARDSRAPLRRGESDVFEKRSVLFRDLLLFESPFNHPPFER